MAQESLALRNGDIAQAQTNQVMETVSASREIASIQGMVFMAKQYPRNEQVAMLRIAKSCERIGLASQAVYSFPKGNQQVEGPSIRLAETLAQSWGNIDFGIRELEQKDGESIVESYAWDLETNTRQSKIFTVPHVLHTKSGNRTLKDPRDIYEMVANNGARRLRACILGVIPGDIVDMAVEKCSETMIKNTKTDAETVSRLLAAFAVYGVTQKMIEVKIGRKFESVTVHQISDLRKIYSSIKDGIATASDCFDMKLTQESLGKPAEKSAEQVKEQPKPEETPEASAADIFANGGL